MKNLIISGYGEDKTMKDSTFGSGINKLSKNIYAKPHYIFKGWSLSNDATSATYQDEQEVDSLTKNDILLDSVNVNSSLFIVLDELFTLCKMGQ